MAFILCSEKSLDSIPEWEWGLSFQVSGGVQGIGGGRQRGIRGNHDGNHRDFSKVSL